MFNPSEIVFAGMLWDEKNQQTFFSIWMAVQYLSSDLAPLHQLNNTSYFTLGALYFVSLIYIVFNSLGTDSIF